MGQITFTDSSAGPGFTKDPKVLDAPETDKALKEAYEGVPDSDKNWIVVITSTVVVTESYKKGPWKKKGAKERTRKHTWTGHLEIHYDVTSKGTGNKKVNTGSPSKSASYTVEWDETQARFEKGHPLHEKFGSTEEEMIRVPQGTLSNGTPAGRWLVGMGNAEYRDPAHFAQSRGADVVPRIVDDLG